MISAAEPQAEGGAWNGAGCPSFLPPLDFGGHRQRRWERPAPPVCDFLPPYPATYAGTPRRGRARSTLSPYPSVALTLITPKTPPSRQKHTRYHHMLWCNAYCLIAPVWCHSVAKPAMQRYPAALTAAGAG